MRKASLTGLTTGTFDEVLVRNPPFSGSLVSVTSLGGGAGSSYDDTEVRSLISQNAAGLVLKHAAINIWIGEVGGKSVNLVWQLIGHHCRNGIAVVAEILFAEKKRDSWTPMMIHRLWRIESQHIGACTEAPG